MLGLNVPNRSLDALRFLSSFPSIPCYLPAVAINERWKRPQKIIVFQIIEHHFARCATITIAVYENTGVFLIHKSQGVLICPQHISCYSHLSPGRRPPYPRPPSFNSTIWLYRMQYELCLICRPRGRWTCLVVDSSKIDYYVQQLQHTSDEWVQYNQTEPAGLRLSISGYLSALSWFLYPFYLSPRTQSLPAPEEEWYICTFECVWVWWKIRRRWHLNG